MAVFIQLADSIPGHKSADYTYRIQIIRDQENNFEREFTSEFQVIKNLPAVKCVLQPIINLFFLIGWRVLGIQSFL